MKMPKLRFKTDDDSDFPEWESFVLNEVCNYSTSRGNGKNYVSTENMLKDFAGVNISPDKEANGIIYQLNDILLSNIRPYLKKAWLANCNGVCSSDVLVLRPTNVEPCLLYYLIANDTFINYVMMSASGTKMPRGDKTSIMNWKLVLPCHEEQRKIANFLLAVDDIIDKQQAEIKAWEQYKKGVAQKLFNQEIRFKADDGSDFPNWECKTLGELGSFQKGAPLSKAAISDNGTPLILYGELYTTYKEIAYDIVRRTEKKVEPKFLSHIGDVLIPTSGETAEDISTATCVMQEGVILGSDLLIYRPVPWLDGRILSYVINHQVKQAISRVAQGPQVVHIKEKDISKIKAYVPASPEEQRKIVECLDAINDVITLSKAELEKWRELKKGLLQQLFV